MEEHKNDDELYQSVMKNHVSFLEANLYSSNQEINRLKLVIEEQESFISRKGAFAKLRLDELTEKLQQTQKDNEMLRMEIQLMEMDKANSHTRASQQTETHSVADENLLSILAPETDEPLRFECHATPNNTDESCSSWIVDQAETANSDSNEM